MLPHDFQFSPFARAIHGRGGRSRIQFEPDSLGRAAFTCIHTRASRGTAREAAQVSTGPTSGSFPIPRSDW